ncbi:MAG: hypothetical protein R3F19_12310 [Verrucomicrobiales bacterium]
MCGFSAELLGVNRNRLEVKLQVVWKPKAEDGEKLELIKLAHAKDPTMGTRQLGRILKRNGYPTARWTVGKMMRYLGLEPSTASPHHGARAAGLSIRTFSMTSRLILRSSLGNRYHLYSVASRACLPDCDYRPAYASRGMEGVEHDGGGIHLEALKEAVAMTGRPQRSSTPIKAANSRDKMVARGGVWELE